MNNYNETDYKILIDALKYTSDIMVTIVEKLSIQEDKIMNLEEIINNQQKLILKNEKITTNILHNFDKINNNELSDITDKNFEFNLYTQTEKELTNIDLETINNTVCNTTVVDNKTVTSQNHDEVKKKGDFVLETLLKRKNDLDKKLLELSIYQNNLNIKNNMNNNNNIVKDELNLVKIDDSNIKTINTTKEILINRRKNNFGRRI